MHAMAQGSVLAVVIDEVSVPIAQSTTHGSLLSGAYVRLSMSDTGAGIPPAMLERIFDAFFTTKARAEAADSGWRSCATLCAHWAAHSTSEPR